jgi:phosphoglycerol transferase MdoB-like AlkP superfamily enzyme
MGTLKGLSRGINWTLVQLVSEIYRCFSVFLFFKTNFIHFLPLMLSWILSMSLSFLLISGVRRFRQPPTSPLVGRETSMPKITNTNSVNGSIRLIALPIWRKI